MLNMEKIEKYARYTMKELKKIFDSKIMFFIVLAISAIMFIISEKFNQYNIAIISITIFWTYNLLYCLSDVQRRFIYLIMNVMFFTFIISRPIIDTFRGNEWWYFSEYSVWSAMRAIFISEIFIFEGNVIAEKYLIKKSSIPKEENKPKRQSKTIVIILLILVIVTGIVNAYVEITKYINMKNVDYALNYTNNVIEIPKIMNIFSSIFPYAIFAYLTTMPKKKYSVIVLGFYILLAIPSFLLGSRNTFTLRLLFSIVYILIRKIEVPNGEIWINKKTKLATIILIPIIIAFLGAYNYIREDKTVQDTSPVALIIDFFYLQGTTFDTICQGFEYEENFKNQPNVISYTFGDIIDYLIHNTISQKIFGTEDLGNGNSLRMANESNSLAHRLSYVVLGENSYLSGHGRGTSYIIETYMDAGILWLAIYSSIIGGYLAIVGVLIKKGNFLTQYIFITTLSQIFILPRYSASGFFSFIVTPQFWSIIILIIIINLILKNKEKSCKDE